MQKEIKDSDTKEANVSSGFKSFASIASYPFAGAVALFTFQDAVNDKLWDNLKKLSAVNKLDEHTTKFRNKISTEKLPNFPDEMGKYHNEWSKIYKDRLKELGFENFSDKLKGLHSNQKTDAAVLAFTAATFALGIGLTIANGDKIFENLFGDRNSQSKTP